MKSRIITFMLSVGSIISLSAQPIAKEFIRIGDKLLPSLSVEQRKDLVDFFQANQKPNTKSLLGDAVAIEQLTDSTLTVRLSEKSRLQAIMLPVDSTYIGLLIYTLEGNISQSRMQFYNRKGDAIDVASLFTPPSLTDFVSSDIPKDTLKQLEQEVGLFFVSQKFDPTTRLLECTLSIQTSHPEREVSPILKTISESRPKYRWNGKRFVRQAAP